MIFIKNVLSFFIQTCFLLLELQARTYEFAACKLLLVHLQRMDNWTFLLWTISNHKQVNWPWIILHHLQPINNSFVLFTVCCLRLFTHFDIVSIHWFVSLSYHNHGSWGKKSYSFHRIYISKAQYLDKHMVDCCWQCQMNSCCYTICAFHLLIKNQ